MKNMSTHQFIKNKSLLKFNKLNEYNFIFHGMTTRYFGNLKKNSLNNKSKLYKDLGLNSVRSCFMAQVHEDKVHVVDEKFTASIKGDALITTTPKLSLEIFTADCLPIFLLEPKKRVVGIVHAGWRGSAKCITQKTLSLMKQTFGIDPIRCIAVLGPCIHVCCYKIQEDVLSVFQERFPEWKDIVIRNKRGIFLDLPKLNQYQLLESGLVKHNICISHFCTYHQEDLFYSHRRGPEKSGRMMSFIGLI
jgi:hypothetical protein